MAKHARLSASGSKQWINCPGSIRREEDYPEGTSSIFAQQGTGAHALSDWCLTTGKDAEDYVGGRVWVHEEKETKLVPPSVKEQGKLEERLAREGYTRFDVVDGEGNGELTEIKCWAVMMFVNCCRQEWQKSADMSAVFGEEPLPFETERYMDGSWLHPLMGGTADWHMLAMDNWIKLKDLKYGAGVSVEVEDNTQQMIYAVLILHEHPEADGVDMEIVQPRLAHKDGPIRPARYTRQQLLDFQAELVDLANETQKHNAPINAGDWCLWCRAKVGCKEFRERTQDLARMDFDDPPEIIQAPTDLEQLAKLAAWMPMLDALNKAVDGAIGRELHQGRRVGGFKLVRGRTYRRYGHAEDHPEGLWSQGDPIEEAEIVGLLKEEALLTEDMMYHPPQPAKLLTLPQMEKLGKDAKVVLKKITYKPEGPLVVAPESDPREEVKIDPAAAFPSDDDDAMEIPG